MVDTVLLADTPALLWSDRPGFFAKRDRWSPAFSVTTSTVTLKAGSRIELNGALFRFDADTAVTVPAHVAGTDYAIYLCADGALRSDANFSAPIGWTTADSRRIGGYHYAPGANAAGYNLGGDTTPQINPYSVWDEQFRPACPDPRGMALVAGRFWADIYLLGVDHHVNGTSRNGVTIADGSSAPKVPPLFGGSGTTAYALTWFAAAEIMAAHGKGLMSYAEFSAAAFGAWEAQQRGTDPVTTGLGTSNAGSSNTDEKFTSAWGLIQAAGCQWTWGADLGQKVEGVDYAAATSYTWKAQTAGRGSLYTQGSTGIAASRFGGFWDNGSLCGSRSSYWDSAPWLSSVTLGARGRCDHLTHG